MAFLTVNNMGFITRPGNHVCAMQNANTFVRHLVLGLWGLCAVAGPQLGAAARAFGAWRSDDWTPNEVDTTAQQDATAPGTSNLPTHPNRYLPLTGDQRPGCRQG